MNLTFDVLENRFVRLEPLGETHKEDLRAACAADPALFHDLYPYSLLGQDFDKRWDGAIAADRAAGTWLHYAVVVDGRCVGMTCYIMPDAVNASVEIGGTYYDPAFRGGATNPASKRLMMTAAFDAGARRVVYRVDGINLRSRAAVLKLGATQEGILRRERLTWTGRVRDTVVFSILDDEWPGVRDRLDARLATFA